MPIPIVEKYKNEKFHIGLQYQYPDLSDGETIVDAEVSVDPEGLTLDGDPVINGDTVKQMIFGGTNMIIFTVTFVTTTSEDNVFTDHIIVKVIF